MSDDLPEHYKTIEHPLESVLDIEEGSTQLPVHADNQTIELVDCDDYDEKDKEIELQFQQVYDAAMEAFQNQSEDSELIEPKFRARNQEVAVQFLNAALNAAKEKSSLKMQKDKINLKINAQKGPNTVNQNLIVTDHSDLMRTLMGQSENDNENE